jgi:UDP-glucose 4-epimerase
MHDQSPNIYGDEEQSMDFIFVKHVVDANIKACESDMTGVYNIASGSRITVN